jgi:hypothetical protein
MTAEVKNPDKPLKGEWDLKPQKVWELDQVGDNQIVNAIIRVAGDGTCYIIDKKTKKNYIVDSSGNFKKFFGKIGEGPGEMKLNLLHYYLNGRVIIADYNKLLYFSKNGDFVKSIRHDTPRNAPFFFIDENNCIAISMVPSGKRGFEREIRRFNLKTKEIKTLVKYRHGMINYSNRFLKYGFFEISGITPWMILGYDYDNKKLYYGMNNSYTINISDLNGNIVNKFSLKRKRKEIPQKAIEKWLKSKRPDVPYQQVASLIPKELCYFHSIQVINGLVYVYVMAWGNHQEVQHIDIFSLDGKYLYRSFFKPGDDMNIYLPIPNQLEFIQRGHLYVTLEDEDGNIKIVKYKVSLPGVYTNVRG